MKMDTIKDYRVRRHLRLRNKIVGTAERPRMAVNRSNKELYVQFIDDENRRTLAAASSLQPGIKAKADRIVVADAVKLGKAAAEAARGKGIERVVFDRGGFTYAGKIKALADAAREGGLKF